MRIIIRDRDTGMYLKTPNEWVVDVEEATDFGDMVKALDVAINIAGRSVDVLMKFADGGRDIRFPVYKV